MEDLLKKISKYDILVYLVPGCLLVIFSRMLCGINLLLNNLVIDCIAIYSYGIIAEIIGTNVFCILEKLGIIKFVDYEEYINVKSDTYKIGIISRKVSIYKSIVGTIIFSVIIWAYLKFIKVIDKGNYILLLFLLIFCLLIVFSIKHQVKHMKERIDRQKKHGKSSKKKK